MSDSDVDLLPSNVFTFQNESTTVSARGPNINASNLTGLSFRNNVMTSTLNLPRNFERQKYMEESSHQRSIYYRHAPTGATSPPMSLRSESSFRPRNYQHMYYPRGMSSQRSMINGRSGSPMSMRSMDSNATVSATDIAMAFKNMNFNKYDLRVIKDAYNQFMKKRMRRKIEKRRNLRLFLKGQRRKSGYDSGELGSDSSISSDDCQSTRTSVYKDNMSSCRSTKTNFSDFRKTMKEDNLYKDCSDSFRQNRFKNMLGVAPRNFTVHSQSRVQNELPLTQKDRFKSGFLLPSQRFNQSVASIPIPEKQSRVQNLPANQKDLKHHYAARDNTDMESEQEEIFSEITIREKSITDVHRKQNIDPRKRCLDIEDLQSQNKRSKLSSPPKNNNMDIQQKAENISNKNKNSSEFEFLKPQFPIRKSGNVKVKETLLAKSAAPLIDEAICAENNHHPPAPQHQCDHNDNNKPTEANEQQSDLTQQSTSDLSMRPSFIKRKLYTQKLDLLESKNLSSENLCANSPQTNVYTAIQKEKHKARKLVTNQSCLSRDVREDNNLLELIHKIVPPDRMNVTNVTNKTEITNITAKNKPEADKWDVTSVINNCINDDVSDTYTDEEIFNNEISKIQSNNNENKKIKQNKIQNKLTQVKKPECKILVEKLPVNKLHKPPVEKPNVAETAKDTNKGKIQNCVKSFWDTDFESDFEGGHVENKVKEKENINHGNLIPKTINNQVNKTLDTSQSKYVWNNKSKPAVTLKSHSFSSQIKTVNVNKSFTKSINDKTKEKKDTEASQPKSKSKASSKATEQPKKVRTKKIVLDTYNSTVSDNNNTQNESVNNNKIRAARAKKNMNTGANKKDDNKPVVQESKLTTDKSTHNIVQANEADKRTISRRASPSLKKFSCCKEPVPVNKKGIKETEPKAKKDKTLDNYNSTFSDNTLEEIIKKGRTRALRSIRNKNIENSIIDDLKRDDSQMFNMTLRSRQLNVSFTKEEKETKSKVPKVTEVKARNTSNSSKTKDTQLKQNKTVVVITPVKGKKAVAKITAVRHSPRINNKVKSAATPVNKRAVKRK